MLISQTFVFFFFLGKARSGINTYRKLLYPLNCFCAFHAKLEGTSNVASSWIWTEYNWWVIYALMIFCPRSLWCEPRKSVLKSWDSWTWNCESMDTSRENSLNQSILGIKCLQLTVLSQRYELEKDKLFKEH